MPRNKDKATTKTAAATDDTKAKRSGRRAGAAGGSLFNRLNNNKENMVREGGDGPAIAFCQSVTNDEDPDKTGLFISLEQLEKAEITEESISAAGWLKIKKRLGKKSKELTEGYVSSTPVMSILASTQLTMFGGEGMRENLGRYDGKIYKAPENKGKIKLKTRSLVLLLNDDFEPLGPKAVWFTSQGTLNQTFNDNWKAHRAEVEEVFGQSNLDNFLHSCAPYMPVFETKLVGSGDKSSLAVNVVGYESPVLDPEEDGYNPEEPINIVPEEVADGILETIADLLDEREGFDWHSSDIYSPVREKRARPNDNATAATEESEDED
jgi:hypothetical protein